MEEFLDEGLGGVEDCLSPGECYCEADCDDYEKAHLFAEFFSEMPAADEESFYFVHFSFNILEVMNIAITARKVIARAVMVSVRTKFVD